MQKTVLITGVSSGIGEATATALARAGYRVFGGARTPAKVLPTPGVELLELDVCKEAQVHHAVDLVLQQVGRIDILINNAGVTLVGPVEATSDAEAQALFDTNLFGALRMMRAVLPAMRQQQSGLILNISSVLGFLPAPFMGLYASSKHALEGLSESLDHEVRDFGVRVMLIQPNFTNTKLDTNAQQTQVSLSAYADALSKTLKAVQNQVAAGEAPSNVASKIMAGISGAYRMRHPVNSSAKMLNFLRRFAPTGAMDKGIRSTFGLKR